MRVGFQEELEQLEASLHEEGTLVLRALRGALTALVHQDAELADEVIAFDDEVDDRYIAIEEGIQNLLARQTPVASDLRLVLAVLHVNVHLERIADYCVTIAKLVKLAPAVAPDRLFIEAFEEMGTRAEEMIRVALESFADRALDRAELLVDLDELIDRANRRFVQHVLSFGRDPGGVASDADTQDARALPGRPSAPPAERLEDRADERTLREWGLRMILVSRCFERIGDHAVDIGERTAYLATGEFREFTDASHPAGG